MVDLMVECTIPMLKSWEDRIEIEGGIGDVRVDEDLRSFSADVISRACFGSSYSNGEEIFSRLRAIRHEMAKAGLLIGLPGLRYVGYLSTSFQCFLLLFIYLYSFFILFVVLINEQEENSTRQINLFIWAYQNE